MTIKVPLHSSTATVKRFRPKISVHPSDKLPFQLEFATYVVFESHSGGARRPRKNDDIFILFDTIPACDRQATIEKTALTHSVARVKSKIKSRYAFYNGVIGDGQQFNFV